MSFKIIRGIVLFFPFSLNSEVPNVRQTTYKTVLKTIPIYPQVKIHARAKNTLKRKIVHRPLDILLES